MAQDRLTKRLIVRALVSLGVIVGALNGTAAAAEPGESKTSGGLTVYLGVDHRR
jgi:hypothetical protein